LHTNSGDNMDINFSDLLSVVFRALLSLVTLFLITKLIGKKQVSQLSLFDYVIGISIGNFAAEMTINLDSHYLYGTIAVIIFGLIAYLISVLSMKSIVLRRFFIGKATVLIQDGVILYKGLKKERFDVNDLLEQCREQGYFDISNIAYAVVEADGKISILPKRENSPVTVKDMNLKGQKASICANVIIDGNIMSENLENKGKDEEWLVKQLDVLGKSLNHILLATLDDSEKLCIYEKNDIDVKDYFE